MLGRVPEPEPGETVTVYLVGGLPAGGIAGLTGWALHPPEGWTSGGHYLARLSDPVLRYVLDRTGGTVELHRASVWYAKGGDLTATRASDAAALLLDAVRTAWGHDGLPMLATPSSWGRDLWLRSIPHGVEYPTLPDELQQLVRSTSGQGRWQSPDRAGTELAVQGPTVPGLFGYDLRFGYGAMLTGLGVGPWTHDGRPDFDPWQRGRYRVRFTVPTAWVHVGLLPVTDATAERWSYPNVPGSTWETWADGAELRIAQAHGWRFDVLERIVGTEGRPLDLFARRLLDVRARLLQAVADGGADRATATLAAAAARTVLLHTIGGLQGAPHRVTRSLPEHHTGELPADAQGLHLDGGSWVWHEVRPSAWAETSHPEWSSAVWARCRARMLDHRGTGALHVPYRDVLAVHSDALYLTGPAPWSDDGQVGTLRLETALPGRRHTPRNRGELLRARDDLALGCQTCGADATTYPPDGSRWCSGCHGGWAGYGLPEPASDAQARAYTRARGGARARKARPRVDEPEPTHEQGALL